MKSQLKNWKRQKKMDEETQKQIDDVINKIQKESINHVSYVKLKELNQSL